MRTSRSVSCRSAAFWMQDLQAPRVDRLGQVVVGAFLDRLDRGLDRPLRGEQDDRDVAHLIAQRLEQREAVHARHDHIGDDDAGTERGDALERFLAVGGGFGDVAPGAHQFRQPETRRPVVLDDEHALRERRRFTAGRRGGFEFEHERWPLRKVVAASRLDSSVKKEVAATARPCNFWQHSIGQYSFYMQIGTTTRNMPTADLVASRSRKCWYIPRHESGAALAAGAAGGLPLLRRPDPAPHRPARWPWPGLPPARTAQLTLPTLVFLTGLDTLLLVGLVLRPARARRRVAATGAARRAAGGRRGAARLRPAAVGVPAGRGHRAWR